MSDATLAHVADALTDLVADRDRLERFVMELLERINRATGAEIPTDAKPTSVAQGFAVLDSLVSPTDQRDGWHWGDPIGETSDGLTGAWDSRADAEIDARDHSDELPHGFVVIFVHSGKMHAPMHVPPVPRGEN